LLLFRKFRNGYELLNFRKANYSNESCGISWGNQFGYTSRGCLIKFHNFRKIRLFHSSLKIPEIFTRIFLRRFVSLFQKSHANVGILMTVECRAASPQKGRNFDDVKKKKKPLLDRRFAEILFKFRGVILGKFDLYLHFPSKFVETRSH